MGRPFRCEANHGVTICGSLYFLKLHRMDADRPGADDDAEYGTRLRCDICGQGYVLHKGKWEREA